MPINPNILKIRVESLAKKSQQGYYTSVSFNSDLQAANTIFYEYLYKQFEDTQKIVDGLIPFISEVSLQLTPDTRSAITPFPGDYRHRLECGVLKVTNAEKECVNNPRIYKGTVVVFLSSNYIYVHVPSWFSGGAVRVNNILFTVVTYWGPNYLVIPDTFAAHEVVDVQFQENKTSLPPEVELYPCDYLLTNEEKYTLTSAVRKPSTLKNIFRHTFKNNLIHVYPRETRVLEFKYLRVPVTPFWDSFASSTANGDIEVFIPIGGTNPNTGAPSLTTDFEFPAQEEENIVDLLLLFMGIEMRSSPLIEFARTRMITTENDTL